MSKASHDRVQGIRIGLTGGIGSGKSTVAAIWAGCGAAIVDTDAIARRITATGGAAIESLRQAFGPSSIDASGALDRARMRERVFGDRETRARLEAILHPMIHEIAWSEARAAASRAVIFDVPLLAESSRWRSELDRIAVVDCSETTQVRRVSARSGWSEHTVRTVISQQAPRLHRRACADAVIFNDGIDIDALEHEAIALWSSWAGATGR